jgi:hypothetical protein
LSKANAALASTAHHANKAICANRRMRSSTGQAFASSFGAASAAATRIAPLNECN